MIFKQVSRAILLVALTTAPAWAAKRDDTLVGAYDAYRAGDAIKFARYTKKLHDRLLAPWVDYWRLSMSLEDASTSDVRAFLAAHADTYVAERLRGEWLKVLGQRGDWEEFDRQFAIYPREDLELRCYAWLSRMSHGEESALGEAKAAIWLEPRELPESCTTIAERLWTEKRVKVRDVWRRARVLFASGRITAAKELLEILPEEEAPEARALAEAARQPERLLARLPQDLERTPVREVVVLAVIRQARNDPEAAADLLDGVLAKRLPEADARYLWARVALEAARAHHDKALKWYARAGDAALDDDALAWKVRAALRRGKWAVVRDTIDRMSWDLRREPAWTYWYGRALAALGEETGSRAYFLRIAGQPDFYGLLADEELGYLGTPPESKYQPSEEDVAKAKREPGLARALELIRAGLRNEGVREWLFAIRGFTDRELLAAAELARRDEVYDRAIHTADRTVRLHNYSLRYPVPFHDVFRQYARSHSLDEAWVLGVVRQESRFIADARSDAGAAGLMQVMPRTARFIARKIGLRHFKHKDTTHVPTNVNLGTGYLKLVLDQLGGDEVLASAAYNAGPSRAQRWRDTRPLEGAIYAETIPFSETRDYVKKVIANSVFYAALLRHQPSSIKARLGTVAPRDASEPAPDDDQP